ncbi:MAG: D-alanyl-D-alanine carboxypeptidase [Clostridia bacterium]|nr:D-alanyl-D-alanine carboxypeptidase [Clostridia bacterium]
MKQASKAKRAGRFFCILLALLFILPTGAANAKEEGGLTVNATSAVLMEAETGKILFAQNETAALPPASVTKVMTLLLVMEALEAGKISWEEKVTVSERAASMGGSQIFLKVGEEMCVTDMVKSVVIASANDAAVALAEHIAGSEEAFVQAMNQRASELGMENTHFENTNGLDDSVTGHLTSAKDIAIMSRELIKHPKILEYSSTWMDTVRDGAFTLTNTNRLVRFYPGATGLKTGSTAKAKFCISATAERNGVSLIAVIMGAESRDVRNAEAKKLLDYGFASFGVYRDESAPPSSLALTGGSKDTVSLSVEEKAIVLPKEQLGKVEVRYELPPSVCAPIAKGTKVGRVIYTVNGETVGEAEILTAETVERITFYEILLRLLSSFVIG